MGTDRRNMEEADVLGDRIAVMSHGRIQALGTGLQLKKRFHISYCSLCFQENDPQFAFKTQTHMQHRIDQISLQETRFCMRIAHIRENALRLILTGRVVRLL